jgi:hypothetical protein
MLVGLLMMNIFALFGDGCGENVESQKPKLTGEYVSIDCQDGDITLRLFSDGTCSIEKKTWDSQRHQHGQILSLRGRYTTKDAVLTIQADDNAITYKLKSDFKMSIGNKSVTLSGWEWQRSTKSTFADKFSLIERKALDAFLVGSVPKK